MENRMSRKLESMEIQEKLRSINNWSLNGDRISKTFKFSTYMDSIKFINDLAVIAEEHNHHPDMEVGWCNIKINYSTHDSDGLTDLDFKMAHFTDELLSE